MCGWPVVMFSFISTLGTLYVFIRDPPVDTWQERMGGGKRIQTRRKLQFMIMALHLRGTGFSVELNRGRFTLYLCSLNWPVKVSSPRKVHLLQAPIVWPVSNNSVIMKFSGEVLSPLKDVSGVSTLQRLLTTDIMFCFLLTKQKIILNISNI